MSEYIKRNWFMILLGLALWGGYAAHQTLAPLASLPWLRLGIVSSVLFAMALPMPLEVVGQKLRRPLAPFLATLINLVMIPLLAWGCSRFLPASLAGGLCVASVVPSTMASAAVWTKRAGGDESIPVMVTLITSALAVIVAPAWLWLTLGMESHLDGGRMFLDLSLTVLLPIVLAKVVTLYRPMAREAKRWQPALSLYCQVGVLGMVTIGSIQLGQASQQVGAVSLLSTLLMMLLTLLIHLVALASGFWMARLCGLPRDGCIGVAIASSQKTLMIGLKIAVDCGVSVLPMIVYHIGQLVLDTAVVDYWRRKEQRD